MAFSLAYLFSRIALHWQWASVTTTASWPDGAARAAWNVGGGAEAVCGTLFGPVHHLKQNFSLSFANIVGIRKNKNPSQTHLIFWIRTLPFLASQFCNYGITKGEKPYKINLVCGIQICRNKIPVCNPPARLEPAPDRLCISAPDTSEKHYGNFLNIKSNGVTWKSHKHRASSAQHRPGKGLFSAWKESGGHFSTLHLAFRQSKSVFHCCIAFLII